jgi:hypothetical protein
VTGKKFHHLRHFYVKMLAIIHAPLAFSHFWGGGLVPGGALYSAEGVREGMENEGAVAGPGIEQPNDA